MPERAVLSVDQLVAALVDVRVIEALKQVITPCVQSAVSTAISQFNERLDSLETKCSDQELLISNLEFENGELRKRVNDLESYSRIENLVFYGLSEQYAEAAGPSSSADNPQTAETSESSEQTVVTFCRDKLQIDVTLSDVSIAHRLPRLDKKQGPRPLLVRFTNRRTRAKILAAKKKLPNTGPNRVYINEHLSSANSKIFAESRKLYRSKEIAATWTFQGRVYVKTSVGGPSRLIQSLQDLADLNDE